VSRVKKSKRIALVGLVCMAAQVTTLAAMQRDALALIPSPPPRAYVSPFSITDVSPDAPYGISGARNGSDPGGKVTSLALDQPAAPPGGIAPPPTLWAGTQYDGVWRSTDGARTWHQASLGITFGVSPITGAGSGGETYLAFDGTNSTYPQRLLFAASDHDSRRTPSVGGLYVSVDGANSWHHVDGNTCLLLVTISSVMFSDGRPFVANGCGIFTTTDPSLQTGWTALPSPPFTTSNGLLASDSAGTLFGCSQNDPAGGLYESQDLGQTWTPTTASLLGTGTCRGLATDPLNGIGVTRTVVEVSDYTPCPAPPTPLPPTCNYEVSTVDFSNQAGVTDQRRTLQFPSDRSSGCCGHPYVFTALRADRPPGLDLTGLSYDIYAADAFHFAVLTGSLATGGGTLIGSAQWYPITEAPGPSNGIHVDTWSGAASPLFYTPSFNACDVWLANDGGVYKNFSADSSTNGSCTPATGWGRAMAGLHTFGSTSISGVPRPQSACANKSQPCPALYVSSGDNDTWATEQAGAGAAWGIMDGSLGDSGSTFLDPALPYQLVTGREGGGGCHLALYYSKASPTTPPAPSDEFDVQPGDLGSYLCFDPPNPGGGGLEPPGNAAFSEVRRLPSDPATSLAFYVTVDNDPVKGDEIVERTFAASSSLAQPIDSLWFDVNPSHPFPAGTVEAVKTSGGVSNTVIYVLAAVPNPPGPSIGVIYRGVENASDNFTWTDASGTAPLRVGDAKVLFVDPYNPNNLFTADATDQTIKDSFDGGHSWQLDSQLTAIANGNGTFSYECNVDPGSPEIVANGCLLKDLHFVPGHPEIRVASTLPGGVAFSRDYGHDWIDLDLTHTGTSSASRSDPQPIQSPSGTFYDPTANPATGQPSLYVALRGAGVERVDGPFTTLGGIGFSVLCASCRTLTVYDDTTGRFSGMARFPDGLFRMTELLNLSGLTHLAYHFVVDGVATNEHAIGLTSSELGSGVVSVDQTCTGGQTTSCTPGITGMAQSPIAITEYQVPSPAAFPQGISAGPDGAMWFGLIQQSSIGRVDSSGHVTEFPLPDPNAAPENITTGQDGNVWFAERGNSCAAGNRIGRLTPSGTLTEFALTTPCSQPYDVTAGPDGALWFTELGNNAIGRITVQGSITEFPLPTGSPGPGTQGPEDIALGRDGALWFTELTGNKIGRVTTKGTFTEFPVPTAGAGASGIASGPDGNLWFTEFFANKIGRITSTGVVTEFPVPSANSQPPAIAAGANSGVLWFTEFNAGKIGRITTDGLITEMPTPTAGSGPAGIAAGPPGTGSIWFTEVNPDKVATFAITASTGNQ
jgi:virginiamycin B lyase